MKKFILFLSLLPGILVAQNITNTLGTNGTFIVEDESNSSLIRASRAPSTRMIFGDFDPSWSLPAGDIDFIHNDGSEKVNIVVGKSGSFTAFPKLQFFYTPGSLGSLLPVVDGEILGLINFGGYRSTIGWSIASSIKAVVDGVPGVNTPGSLVFITEPVSGNPNEMTFDSGGNLTVPGAITSQAITQQFLNVDNGDTYNIALNDQTVIISPTGSGGGNIDVFLPSAATLSGKTFTIKKGNTTNTRTITVNTINSENIDSATSFVITGGYAYITVQSNGSNWFIIAEGAGN